ncbi:MAG: CDP-diacylglycerol--serine O-phosphatidyltransferase [Candidatus Binatia bacterium]
MTGPRFSVVSGRPRRRIPPLRNGVYLLPNLVTTAGLFAGFYSIILTQKGQYRQAAIMILLAQVADMLDGRIARLTRTASSFGVQYDSLADLIAFGVAPAILLYRWALGQWGQWGWLAASLYVTAGALRLARFNVQVGTVEKRHFLGLPIPAAADVIATTVLLYYRLGFLGDPNKHLTMLLVTFGVAGLMVSEVRYFSFKDIRLHHRHPFSVLIGLIFLAAVTIGAPEVMLFLGTVTYALSGPVGRIARVVRHRHTSGRRDAPPSAPSVLDNPGHRG